MSTQAKHSCGPWEFDGKKIISPDRYVCSVDDWSTVGAGQLPACFDETNRALHEEAQANAHLIKAAPDLLHAARLANEELCALGVGSSGSPALRALWWAIARAEGKEP